MMSSWRPVTSGVPQGLMPGPVAFTTVINDLDDKAGSSLIKLANDRELGGVADTLESRAVMQKDLVRLEKWDDGNLMNQFDKGKC